ncbi:hypothetical protein C0583_01725 [Candidatus Parcubacteria bacterium]|nr:MAG: hypothetical protein C0583_01725 [Candidatus Parcubacteria bacterium]
MKEADIIFIRGGKDVVPLVGILKKIDKLKDVLKNKFVIGSSAGVYALSKYYIRGNGEIFEGLGVLNIKSICHFSDDRSDLVEKLLNYKEDLELIKIPEEEIVLIEQ